MTSELGGGGGVLCRLELSVKPEESKAFDVPAALLSVWLPDSRLKPTWIIPLVEHADTVCLFLFTSSFFFPLYFKLFCLFVLALGGKKKKKKIDVLRCVPTFWRISLLTFQGEIGELGQKVKVDSRPSCCVGGLMFSRVVEWQLLFFFVQGEPGIGHRGPEGQAGPPGQKVTCPSFLVSKH